MLKKVALVVASLCITVSTAVTAFASPELGYNRLIIGDINNDYTIDSLDYSYLNGALIGTQTLSISETVAADVNGDGALTPTDKEQLQNYILSIPGNTANTGSYYYIVYGDVELNGNLSEGDLDFLSSYILGQSNMSFKQLAAADINNDGSIDSIDLAILNNYLY